MNILYHIIRLVSYMPFWALYALSDVMYYLLYYVIRYRREIVRKNLSESFPEKSTDEIVQIEKRFYHFFMDMILESSKLASISRDEIKTRMRFVNPEVMNGIYAQGKSITAFIGHFCNWEWMTSAGLWMEGDTFCAQVYHRLNNKTIDDIMKRMRERLGKAVCVEMRNTARFANNMTAEGKTYMLALIADQSPKRREIKYYVHFLNHDVPVLVGPEKLTKHYGYVPVFVNVHRVKRGYYDLEISVMHDDPESVPDYELTEMYYRRLEEEISRQPECYLWTHKRFRYARH